MQWQTSIPHRPPATGWGGRCADLLDTYNPKNGNNDVLSLCISLAGSNTFEVGATVQGYSISSSGVVALNSALGPSTARTAQQATLNNLLGIDAAQQTCLCRITRWRSNMRWQRVRAHHFDQCQPNGRLLENLSDHRYGAKRRRNFTSSMLAQMKMVAQVIEAGYRPLGRRLGMKRQIFFVQVGGYDRTRIKPKMPAARPLTTPRSLSVRKRVSSRN